MWPSFRSRLGRHGAIALALLLVSLWSMYPVLAEPRSRVVGWKGDNVLYAYMTGWIAQSLLQGDSPFVDPHANYPDSLQLAANEAPFLSMFLVAPLTWLFGPVFGYNAIMLLSAFLSGVCMYLWVYRMTGSRFGGLIAGIMFILTPYRIVRNYGHLNLISLQALPLFFWALDVLLRNPLPTRRQLAAVGGAVFLVGAMSQYYLVICALTGLVYLLVGAALRWRDARRQPAAGARGALSGIAARRGEWGIVGAAAVLLIGALAWAGPTLREPHRFDMVSRAIAPLSGPVSEPEVMESTGRIFRWTMGPVDIAIPNAGGGAWTAQLNMYTRHPDASPTQASLHFADGSQISLPDDDLRTVHLFVPESPGDDLRVTLRSNLYREPSASQRDLGVGVFAVAVQPTRADQSPGFVPLSLWGALTALGGLLTLRLWPVGWRRALAGGLLLAAGLLGLGAVLGRLSFAWLAAGAAAVWAVAAAIVLARAVRALPVMRGGLQYLTVAGLGAGLSALPYIITRINTKGYKAYPIEDTRWFSASPENYLVPSNLHPLWGGWIERNIDLTNRIEGGWIEHTAYLGAVALILAAAALFWRRTPYRRSMTIWAFTIVAAVVYSLGTDLHLAGRPVNPAAPDWLPMYYLGQLPVVSLMRVWARFSIVVIVLVTAMAGVGAALIYRRLEGRRLAPAVAAGLLVLALLDLAPGRLQSAVIAPRPIDLWLAQQPGDFAAAFLPEKVEPFPALFGILTHGKSITAYNHDQHRPAAYNDFARRAGSFPDEASLRLLKDLKLRYLLINLTKYDAVQRGEISQALAATTYGSVVTQVNEWLVFEFK